MSTDTIPCQRVEITGSEWRNETGTRIESACAESEVFVSLDISNFVVGDKINVEIREYSDNVAVLRSLQIDVTASEAGGVEAISEKFRIKKEWSFRELAIYVKNDGCEKGSDSDDSREYELDVEPEFIGARLTVMIDYVNVRIKVLDVRSGEPIPTAKIKDIRLMDGNTNLLKKKKSETETGFELADKKISITAANSRIKASINALQKITGKEQTNDTAYSAEMKALYEEYWQARAEGANITFPPSGNPSDNVLDFIIREYNDHLQTDSNGVLSVWIPANLIEGKSVSLQVGFWNFPVVQESTNALRRSANDDGTPATNHFKISWGTGTQGVGWGNNFNWFAENVPTDQPDDDDADNDNKAQLKVSETLELKETNGALDRGLFASEDWHFVLFGMEWCQPVWDGIEDDDEQSLVQHNDYSNLNMHIVSTYFDQGGNDNYGGKGYGKAEYRTNGSAYLWRSGGHRGIDLHAVIGDNVFAVHGGKLTNGNSTRGGNTRKLHWKFDDNDLNIEYLHLNDYITIVNNYAMSGQIIAHAGRTGNLGQVSQWPGHVHLNVGVRPTHEIGLRSSLSDLYIDNLNVIPCNDYPLLFPCACAVTFDPVDPSGCNFNNTTFVNPCWVVAEMRCPHMNGADKRNRRIQAQLKHLGFYTDLIDGIWGIMPTNGSSRISNTRDAIYRFKTTHNVLIISEEEAFDPANYDISETDELELNTHAPIRVNV